MATKGEKRVKVSRQYSVNLFFQHKLQQWKVKAESEGSQRRYTYAKALRSLRKYALPLSSGTEAKRLLRDFGDALGKQLDDALAKYRREYDHEPTLQHVKELMKEKKANDQSATAPPPPATSSVVASSKAHSFFNRIRPNDQPESSQTKKLKLSSRDCGDSTQSSAISTGTGQSFATFGQSAVSSSQSAASSGQSAMSSGQSAASSSQSTISSSQSSTTSSSQSSVGSLSRHGSMARTNSERCDPVPDFSLFAGQYDLILLVDTQETAKFAPIIKALDKNNVVYQVRQLPLGDYLWVARGTAGEELVLEYIVERKRLDDLGQSIVRKGGRYREQKARIRECQFEHPIFLVEMMKNPGQQHLGGLSLDAINQAITNTQIHDKFHVHVTKNPEDTALYLAELTRMLKNKYAHVDLCSSSMTERSQSDGKRLMPFEHYKQMAVKSPALTVQELLSRQLMVVKGMTGEKANAISGVHGSFETLISNYARKNKTEREKLLSSIVYNPAKNQKIGDALSKQVARFFCYGL